MNFKKLASGCFNAFKTLPIYGKIFALASVAILIAMINPGGGIKAFGYYADDLKMGDDGELRALMGKVPDFYVNTSKAPAEGDFFDACYELVTDKNEPNGYKADRSVFYYVLRDHQGWDYVEIRDEINDYCKNKRRKMLLVAFLFTAALTLVSYPGLMKRIFSPASKR